MQRIQTANRAVDAFGPGKDGFRAAVPGVSEPTYLNAAWFNSMQEALVRVVEAAGISLDAGDYDQFSQALGQLYVGRSFIGQLASSNLSEGSALIGHRASTVQDALDTLLEQLTVLGQAQNAGVIGHDTLEHLNADLDHRENTIAYVTNDPTPENNTTWRKLGDIGAGSWTISSSSPVNLLKTLLLGMISATNEKAATLSNYVMGILDTPADVPFAIADPAGNAVLTISQTGVVDVVELSAARRVAIKDVQLADSDMDALAICDADGNAILRVSEDGLHSHQITLGADGPHISGQLETNLEFVDENGNAALRLEGDGAVTVAALNALHQFRWPGEIKPVAIPSDITMVIGYGQSWAAGFENYAISLVPRFDNLMFNGGIRTQCISEDPAVVMNAFLPLVERQDTHTPEFPSFGGGGMGETTTSGALEIVKELLYTENNLRPENARCQLLGTSPGEGSASIEHLSPGSYIFDRVKAQILAGYQLAQAAGKTFSVGAITWVQGTSEGPTAAYPAQLEALRLAVDTYARSVCGQANDVQLVTWQSFAFDGGVNGIDAVYLRHVKELDQYPHIHTTGGCYHFENSAYDAAGNGASLHFTGQATKWLAAYLGLVVKRVVFDQVTWRPVRPLTLRRQGRLCTIDFHVPVGHLVWDTTQFHPQPNYGFNLYRADGTEIPLSQVSITGPARVTLQASATIPAGSYVRYGGTQATYGRYTGRGGNLRDTQGEFVKFDGDGQRFAMHNWSVLFKEVISN